MLVWLSNAGGLTIVVSYMMVSISFLVLRKNEPNMSRPYRVKNGKFVGTMAVLLCVGMICMYMPGGPASLIWPYEWGIILAWSALGAGFFGWMKWKAVREGSAEVGVIEQSSVS
jgi:amino acid transporter